MQERYNPVINNNRAAASLIYGRTDSLIWIEYSTLWNKLIINPIYILTVAELIWTG
jgi:hypothetical protein